MFTADASELKRTQTDNWENQLQLCKMCKYNEDIWTNTNTIPLLYRNGENLKTKNIQSEAD